MPAGFAHFMDFTPSVILETVPTQVGQSSIASSSSSPVVVPTQVGPQAASSASSIAVPPEGGPPIVASPHAVPTYANIASGRSMRSSPVVTIPEEDCPFSPRPGLPGALRRHSAPTLLPWSPPSGPQRLTRRLGWLFRHNNSLTNRSPSAHPRPRLSNLPRLRYFRKRDRTPSFTGLLTPGPRTLTTPGGI